MSTIFISHSSGDNDIARELQQRLERLGHTSIFLDLDPEKGIIAGVSWEQTLYRKLRACRAVIAVCTDNYLQSHWCFAEIALARMEGKYIFAVKVDPLSDSAKLPSILTEKQYIDLRSSREEGLQRLWRGLSDIDVLGMSTDWDPRQSPYLGLSAYQEKHAPVFFGREVETQVGIELLERGAPGMIMALGASGTGKSSLVKAGILPRLRLDPDRWLIIDPMRPGIDPFYELARVLLQTIDRYAPVLANRIGSASQLAIRLKNWELRDASPAADRSTVRNHKPVIGKSDPLTEDKRVQHLFQQLEELHQEPPQSAAGPFLNFLDWSLEDLRRICGAGELTNDNARPGANHLTVLIDELRRQCSVNARVLLVVDQFEELLGHSDLNHPSNSFLRLLRASIEFSNSPMMVLGTMRSDYLGTFQHTPALHNIDFESLSIGPVSPDSLRRIIEAPAKLAAVTLESGLTDRLIADTGTADALPLLSFTLWVLWRDYREDGEIEIAEYEQLGGLHGAITREADSLLDKSNEVQLRNAFLQMARLSEEGNYARRPVAWDNKELRPVQSILEKYIERRLLVVRGDVEERRVEVAHEALFRSWKPLRRWLDENRNELMLKQEIARESASWLANDRPKDNLWRGARLEQARGLLSRVKLDVHEEDFIKSGVRRGFRIKLLVIGTMVLVFTGMTGLTWNAIQSADKALEAEVRAQAFEAEAITDYYGLLNALSENEIQRVLTPEAAWGELKVDDSILTEDKSLLLKDASPGNQVLAAGTLGNGRLFATAHDGVLTYENSRVLLKNIIRWMTPDTDSANIEILYSVGHCEVVSNRLRENLLAGFNYSINYLQDLTDFDALSKATILIIGNAWGSFTAEEITSVERYVEQGGGVIMAGIYWSWDQYKESSDFNPCEFESLSFSSNKKRVTDAYPMNSLAKGFGIEWY